MEKKLQNTVTAVYSVRVYTRYISKYHTSNAKWEKCGFFVPRSIVRPYKAIPCAWSWPSPQRRRRRRSPSPWQSGKGTLLSIHPPAAPGGKPTDWKQNEKFYLFSNFFPIWQVSEKTASSKQFSTKIYFTRKILREKQPPPPSWLWL